VVPAYLYLTEELLSAIDGVRGGKSRSQWVREAIEEKLARGDEEGRGR
jgi:metal-responsive CopG/Arc/MetJ family transcriptional regulator